MPVDFDGSNDYIIVDEVADFDAGQWTINFEPPNLVARRDGVAISTLELNKVVREWDNEKNKF